MEVFFKAPKYIEMVYTGIVYTKYIPVYTKPYFGYPVYGVGGAE